MGTQNVALFAFNGDPMCFIHVLLNALNMKQKGYNIKIIIEGSATKLIPEFTKDGSPLKPLYLKAEKQGLVEGACKACSNKMGTLEAAKAQGFVLLDDMSGHPSMSRYMDAGYKVISF